MRRTFLSHPGKPPTLGMRTHAGSWIPAAGPSLSVPVPSALLCAANARQSLGGQGPGARPAALTCSDLLHHFPHLLHCPHLHLALSRCPDSVFLFFLELLFFPFLLMPQASGGTWRHRSLQLCSPRDPGAAPSPQPCGHLAFSVQVKCGGPRAA